MKIGATLQATMQSLEKQANLAKKVASELNTSPEEEATRARRFGKAPQGSVGNNVNTKA